MSRDWDSLRDRLVRESRLDGVAMGVETLGFRKRADGRTQRGQPVARQALDLEEVTIGLDRQRAAGAGEATRWQHVVGARRVIAGRLGTPPPDEDGAGVPDPRDRVLEV